MPSAPVWLEHPSSLRPRHRRRIPSSRRGSSRSSASCRARDWLGFERVTVAGGRSRRARGGPPRGVRRVDRAGVARTAAATLDADTVVSAGSFEAALHAAGGAVADGRPAARRRRRRTAFSAHRPPGHHALRTARDGVLPVQQHRGRGAVRARRPRPRARDDRRLGRAPRQRDQRHLPRERSRCCSSRSTSRRCTRGPGRRRTSGPATGEGFTVNLPGARPGPATRCSARSSITSSSRWRESFEPQLMLISAGYDAHREDPLADVRGDRGRATPR